MDAAPVVPRVLQAFRQSQSNHSRLEALEALTAELTPHEWRALQAKLNTRHFRCDILGALPVELVASVFAHLDVSVPYRLQRVSKRWHQLLSSVDVLRTSLQEWDGKATQAHEDYQRCQHRARAIQSFRQGIPVRSSITAWKSTAHHPPRIPTIVDALFEDTFVWLDPHRRFLNVTNLRTMAQSTLQGDARERITNVALSDELVAFATSLNNCYVVHLINGNRNKFKLAQPMYQQLTCRGRIVACAGFVSTAAVIYIWDYDTRAGRSFEINLLHPPFASRVSSCFGERNLAILLDPSNKSITVFTGDRCSHQKSTRGRCGHMKPGCSIHYSRFTFDGQRIQDDLFIVPILKGLHLRGFHPAGSYGRFALSAMTHTSTFQRNHGDWISIPFDERLQKFTDPHCPGSSESPWVGEDMAWWNDTFFQLIPSDIVKDTSKSVLLAHIGTSGGPRKLTPQIFIEPKQCDLYYTRQLFVNDRYVVVMYMTLEREPESHILYFEDEFKPASGSDSVLGMIRKGTMLR